jgi:hypothetical protein
MTTAGEAMPQQEVIQLHVPPHTLTWYLRHQGQLVEVKECWNWRESKNTVKRGTINQFSRASRLRLLKFFATVDWERIGPSSMITLTYPDQVVDREYHIRTRDRYLFTRAMEKHLKQKVGLVWRVEWKERQSGKREGQVLPHIHLIVFNCPYIPWEQIRAWWRAILHHEGPLATDVRQAKGMKEVLSYVAKYLAKVEGPGSLDNDPYLNSRGRQWGICRKSLIPMAKTEVAGPLNPAQIWTVRDLVCDIYKDYHQDTGSSFTLLGGSAEDFMRKLEETGLVKVTTLG